MLDYQFKNPKLLLEALTHSSFKDQYHLDTCYEKLEVLGDALLDYIVNANLINYTLTDRYNLNERIS